MTIVCDSIGAHSVRTAMQRSEQGLPPRVQSEEYVEGKFDVCDSSN